MAVPVPTLRVDWANSGAFTGPNALVHPLDSPPLSYTRGRSGDFTADATGQLTFSLDNSDERFSFDRNWADNPSFEVDALGWSTAAIASLTAAATSITQVTDNAGQGGTKAGEAVLTASANSGVAYAIPYRFRHGVAHSVSVWLKSTAGNLNIRVGLASSGTPADIASSSVNITAAWAAYTFTWTPSVDRTDAVLFVRTVTNATATVRIDAVQVNPGLAANPYLEGPTKGQLVPGRPVHLYATYSAVDYPLFFGYIERITPDLDAGIVTITVYDPLRRMGEITTVVPANAYVQRTARDMRIEVLSDFERGTINLCHNGSVESAITGWSIQGGGTSVTRNAGDAAPGLGSACAQFIAASANSRMEFPLRLAPVYFAGQTYRFSVWLKDAGAGTWTVGAYGGTWTGAGIADKSLTLTTSWVRYTFTVALPATYTSSLPLTFFILAQAAGTVLADGLMVSRGYADPLYTTVVSGRWPSWCGNGGFDAGSANGWHDGFGNLVGNPSFETNTAGWSTAGDAFVASATSLTRVVADPVYGSARADIVNPAGAGHGVFYAITGTFLTGRVYEYMVWVKVPAGGPATITCGIGSQGTPADFASANAGVNTAYVQITGTWTPTGSRADAHLYVSFPGPLTVQIDGTAVFARSLSSGVDAAYSDTGPGGGGKPVTSRAFSLTAKYGYRSMSLATPATANAGTVYDFNHYSVYFLAGQPYTASVWLNPSSNMPYKVGIGGNAGNGSWDEASATGTATANTWTQVTVTWTPSADRSAAVPFAAVLFIYQTDATARTVLIDGVRVIPGASADNFEQPYWNIPGSASSDAFMTTASLTGTALAALGQINGMVLSRHWITATMAAPFWQYNVQDRASYAAATSVETFTDGVLTSAQAVGPPELDRQAIVNAIAISAQTGTETYTAQSSVDQYGYRPGPSIGGGAFFSDQAVPALIAAAYLSRFSQPIRRPTFTVENRWPSQLQRDVNDMVTLTVAAWLVWNLFGNIARLTTTVDQAGQHWKTEYTSEESLGAG